MTAIKADRRFALGRFARFPVVGVGASAGGLEALEKFVAAIRSDGGAAYVVVTHQHPGHVSLLPELLAKYAHIKTQAARDGVRLQPNTLYLSTSEGYLTITDGALHIMKAEETGVLRLPIDCFFQSLAADQQEKAVGIVLSGTGTDGTMGLKAIKRAGGMAIAQDPKSAKYSGMPSSAIDTGEVDFILPVEQMPRQLDAYIHDMASEKTVDDGKMELSKPMREIIVLLRARTGHDFSSYKENTLRRRLERRINVHRLRGPVQYLQFIRENPDELDLVFRELLIGVTRFFRDPEAFGLLAKTFIPKLLDSHPENTPVRIWTPGCSTGEEAYSLAILTREAMDRRKKRFSVQIFGTDLDGQAIETARAGHYPAAIERDVRPQRLGRFFVKEGNGYRVKKEIREMVIFATQNVLRDPPFTKLDLISCRNLLIYFNPEAQRHLFELFHYALRPGGALFLGSSENIHNLDDRFTVGNKRWKIFTCEKTAVPSGLKTRFQTGPGAGEHAQTGPPVAGERFKPSFSTTIEKMLLAAFAPASVIVNEKGDIVYIHGRTGEFLEPASGQPRLNILEMARENIRVPLGAALRRASGQAGPVIHDGIQIKTGPDFSMLRLEVSKLDEPEPIRGLLLVTFQTRPVSKPVPERTAARPSDKGKSEAVTALEQELQYTKETLQSTVEELQTSNEELKSINEEMQSTNEELQSVNEELETSKEEMQSLNEELQTVNAQLQAKVEDLAEANDDMQNLLNSTEIATIFLDLDLRIKRFTKEATKLINLIPTDVGRPISHLASNLDYGRLQEDAADVLRTLVFKEREVQTRKGDWRQVRISPYRTTENVIDGLVVTFVDVNRIKQAEQAAEARRDYAEGIVATVREPLVVLDETLRVVSCNESFFRTFRLQPGKTVGRLIYEIANWDIPRLRQLLETVLPQKSVFHDFRMIHQSPRVGRLTLLLNARQLNRDAHLPGLILLAMEDITKSRRDGGRRPSAGKRAGPPRAR